MGKQFSLTSADKFQLGAYRADPSGPAKGGIVVIQEIFGVNAHIRAVADGFAAEGYVTILGRAKRFLAPGETTRSSHWLGDRET